MKRRPGFTLIELLTVMIIIGLLAAIAVSRFWSVKERSYRVALKNDLRNIAVQQERYFEKNMAYSANVSALPDVALSQGVTITINYAASDGWGAIAEHASLPGEQCGYFTGAAPAASGAPATQVGTIKCSNE